MRKLILDDRIRGFASTYKTGVLRNCPNVVKDLENLKSFVIANNVWDDSATVEEYIDMIIADYPSLLSLEPKDWDLKKYKEIEAREPGMLTNKVIFSYNSRGEAQIAELYERIVFCMRYTDARVILGSIHQDMGLKSCVYCNAESTLTGLDNDVFYQMDHFLPKSIYPFLCTCFYNLQPSCGGCNNHKLIQDSDFGLYVNKAQGVEVNPFLFVPQVNDIKGMGDFTCIRIGFTGKDKKETTESIEHNRVFHIVSKYYGHREKVKDIYDRAYKMTESYIKATHDAYGVSPTKQDVLSFIEKFPLKEDRIHEKPFTKLRQDTMKQLIESGLI